MDKTCKDREVFIVPMKDQIHHSIEIIKCCRGIVIMLQENLDSLLYTLIETKTSLAARELTTNTQTDN